ncbi:MAG: LpxI family protein, partial [Hyphomicrobium aestuarii]|nr:LpxI family protein [Hyphomicrobium aestuarii]
VEAQGFEVVGIADVAPGLLVPAGALGLEAPGPSAMADILLASSVVRVLGRHDIVQAVIVADGVIEAIEGAEGTDRMLDRVAAQRARAGPRSDILRGVLVKRPKPGQEMRIDMPAIGPRTVERAKAAGLAGLAVLAGATLAADREDLVAMADREGLYVYGFTEGDPSGASRPGLHRPGLHRPVVHGPVVHGPGLHRPVAPPMSPGSAVADNYTVAQISVPGTPSPRRMFAGASLARSELADACAGAAALESLAALGPSGSAVVVNGYVIGIDPGASAIDLVDRTRTIRPWGIARWRRRAGVVIVNHAVGDAAALVSAAVEAKLAAIAICSGTARHDGTSVGQLAELAAGTGIAVVRMTPRLPG